MPILIIPLLGICLVIGISSLFGIEKCFAQKNNGRTLHHTANSSPGYDTEDQLHSDSPERPKPVLTAIPVCIDLEIKNIECSICYDEYIVGHNIKILPCGHFYHDFCIDLWLDKSVSCPVCRSNFI